ncbi:BlaI/MecI/CopY family transcriptional regulator [Paraglaciecola hydrolytica]|uniref:Transcriptional regulator n=1 Tax=Paraglaciecola hydrolytica TaxID=1799789 RepID=A0A148KLG1_9ALTE|nr:BlaI/MecI/CopY family transcriptional regulator [Paraglaciecola hydrolytica]KXI27088.1 transcriptional regulator [Paraglaciecola hydrolytica]
MIAPTPSELEILNILWKSGEATTQIVNDQLNLTRPVGYTTTLKTMQLMTEKGLLDRRKEGKSHVYFALSDESKTKSHLLDKIIQTTFGGSTSGLLMQLFGNKAVSQDEIVQIRAFLDGMEDKNHG